MLTTLFFCLALAPCAANFFSGSLPFKRESSIQAGSLALSMNGESFLHELLILKDATNIKYAISHQNKSSKLLNCLPSNSECSASCEYSGNLWFLPKGIAFRETMVVKGISKDENRAILECSSDYHNGKKWIQCARTTCEIESSDETEGKKLRMVIKSDLLVRLPIPGIGNQVAKMISSTFQNAAVAFFQSQHGMNAEAIALL